MPKGNRTNVSAMGKNLQQENLSKEDEELRFKIWEMKAKIKMKERRLLTEREKYQEIISQNDRTILEMRAENTHLRGTARQALNNDELLVSEALSDRKIQRLALVGKSSQAAIKEIDETICGLARKLNDLSHKKKIRMEKLNAVEKQFYQSTQKPGADPEISTRARQLENSINKVSLKSTTACRIKDVYIKIRKALEDELRGYPNLLDKQEKEIFSQRTELEVLKEINQTASAERDVAVEEKTSYEIAVRDERRQRDVTIRALRNRVKAVSAMLEIPHTRGRHNRLTDDEQQLAKFAKRTEDMLDKIKEYQEKAAMLEVVTGIPFSNKESLINCFKNQKNSSTQLQAQTQKNNKVLRKNRNLLAEYQRQYDKMLYDHENSMQEKLRSLKHDTCKMDERKAALLRENQEANALLKETQSWLEPVIIRLLKSCDNLKLKGIDALVWKASEYVRVQNHRQQDIHRLFSVFVELLTRLEKEAHVHTYELECTSEHLHDKEVAVLLNNNNNRVSSTLERKVSEDFDFNTPNNDEYLSRTTIKRQAESRQRGGGYERT